MSNINPVTEAIEILGLRPLADGCKLKSYQAVKKWEKNGLPRTEWTGETNYSENIESLTNGQVTKERLLEWTKQLKEAA